MQVSGDSDVLMGVSWKLHSQAFNKLAMSFVSHCVVFLNCPAERDTLVSSHRLPEY